MKPPDTRSPRGGILWMFVLRCWAFGLAFLFSTPSAQALDIPRVHLESINWSEDCRTVTVSYEADKPVRHFQYRLHPRENYISTTNTSVTLKGLKEGEHLLEVTAQGADGCHSDKPCMVRFYTKPTGKEFQVSLRSYELDDDSVTFKLQANRPVKCYYVRLKGFDDAFRQSASGVVTYRRLPAGKYCFTATARESATNAFPPGGPVRHYHVSSYNGDGEGLAKMVPRRDLVAGATDSFRIEYTAGPRGISSGGGIAMMFAHASIWRVQLDKPEQANYAEVLREDGERLHAVSYHVRGWTPEEMMPCRSHRMNYHRGIIASVGDRPLAAGEKVSFVMGAGPKGIGVPIAVDKESGVRVFTDADGDGSFWMVRRLRSNDIIAGPVDHLVVTVSATGVVGESADILVRAEDRYLNLATDCELKVTLDGIPGMEGERVRLEGGLARTVVRLTKRGLFRVSGRSELLTSSNRDGNPLGHLEARSNPVVVTDKPPEYRVYWGDIHGHTQNSDGLAESAEVYFRFGRDVSGLDVCAVTEHLTDSFGRTRKAVKAFNEPGRFVTILAFEWGGRTPDSGDKNVYYRSDDDKRMRGWPTSPTEFFDKLHETYGDNSDRRIIVGPHHFTFNRRKGGLPFDTWDPRYERFVEIYSCHGMSEFPGNPRPLVDADPKRFMVHGLARGLRFGIIASSDTHDSRPGRARWGKRVPGGLVAFLAKDLTRESIWDAFWNRRVYATTTPRIYIDFRIDGHVMGREFVTDGAPKIEYTVHGCDDAFEVFLIKDNEALRRTRTTDGTVRVNFVDKPVEKDSFYYLRVVQDDGEWAWSSPIWVGKPGRQPLGDL